MHVQECYVRIWQKKGSLTLSKEFLVWVQTIEKEAKKEVDDALTKAKVCRLYEALI